MRNDHLPTDAVPTERSTVVKVQGLTKTFRRRKEDVHVLKNVDLEVEDGELLVLLGPSGCGKTTLLRCLAGLERPNLGRVELGGTSVVDHARGVFLPPNRRDVGMVFQNYALWPHMKVAENVAYPLKARRLKGAIKDGRVAEVLDVVQCGHLADRYPPELSGGQQQRISLARALAPRPSLLLLDEPLSNLDALLRIELRAQLRALHRHLGFTGIYVTHDQEEAIALGTRVAVMNAGRVEQVGKPADVYNGPATEYVADFLGARNRFAIEVGAGDSVTIEGVEAPGLVSPGSPVRTLLVRDSYLRLRPRRSTFEQVDGMAWLPVGEVVEVVPGAEHAECLVMIGENRIFAAVPNGGPAIEPGQAVDVGIDLLRAFGYDTEGQLVEQWSRAHVAARAEPAQPAVGGELVTP